MNTNPRRDLFSASSQFKKEAAKSIIAIFAFIIVYLLLFALSVGLAALSIYAGFLITTFKLTFLTALLGLGLAAFGVMVFVFLIKFLFATSTSDATNSVEITAKDEPELFEMIYQLAKETGTSRPKKVFLTPDVNASVFYNSSVWSMFFPVRKNLNIGLGLVSALNVSELRAVIAHEFCHFSQRSMKLGGWVHQVNKIIYDMLFNNQGYLNGLTGIAKAHSIFAMFAELTVKVVQFIQWTLRQMYVLVNKSYLGLSRQMEFHADLVSASVCGSNNIVSALRRIEFADVCYAATIDICNEAWNDKKVVADFYTNLGLVTKDLAKRNGFSLLGSLPMIEENGMGIANRVNFKNQWSSHPSLSERSEYLKSFDLLSEVNSDAAWTIFIDKEKWKHLLTQKIYDSVPQEEINQTINESEFEQLLSNRNNKFSFPEIFKDYYDNRQIKPFDVEAAISGLLMRKDFEEVFPCATILLPKKLTVLSQDIAILRSIEKKEIDTRSFDFDGEKYHSREAAKIADQLEIELAEMEKQLETSDIDLFRHFYSAASFEEADRLRKAYQQYFDYRSKSDEFSEKVKKMMDLMAPIFQGETMLSDAIHKIISDLKQKHEPALKKEWSYWSSIGTFDNESDLDGSVKKFIESDYRYFFNNSYLEHELKELHELNFRTFTSIYNYVYSMFKSITEVQAEILSKTELVQIRDLS